MNIQKFFTGILLNNSLYACIFTYTQMFAQLCNFYFYAITHSIKWFGGSMQCMKLGIYQYTCSVAEQLHFATIFISLLSAKHMSKAVPHLLHTHQITALRGRD